LADWSRELDASKPVLVYCVHGHEVSQSVALALRARTSTRFVTGGIEACRAAGAPLKRRSSTMKWITRERPKIDRIACPWLIARFIDKEPDFSMCRPARC
jgi:hypothetical protein